MAPSIYTKNEPPMQSPSRKQAPPPTSAAMNLPPMASPSSRVSDCPTRAKTAEPPMQSSSTQDGASMMTRITNPPSALDYQRHTKNKNNKKRNKKNKKTGPELFAHRPPTARPPQATVNGSSVQLPQDETWENVHAPSTTDKNKSGNQNTPYFNLPIHFPNEVQDKAILRTSSDSKQAFQEYQKIRTGYYKYRFGREDVIHIMHFYNICRNKTKWATFLDQK